MRRRRLIAIASALLFGAGQAPGADEAALEREQAVDEDPLNEQQTEAQERAAQTPRGVRDDEPNSFDLYGSLRVRYRTELRNHGFSDGGSRVGLEGRYQFLPQKWLFARGEAGFNLLDELGALVNANGSNPDGGSGDTFFRRLLYLGYESPDLFLVVGKSWSPYYQITGFTDRFFGAGGQAAGTYNAGTDGGYTGTGRAENALQTRARIKYIARALGLEPFRLNIQLQDGEPIPNIAGRHYGPALGLSALIATREHFTAGIAYNLATIPDPRDPALRERGIHGNAQAVAAGVRWFDDDWYLGTVLARLRNHEATDEHNFFDGWGWEVYAQYRLGGRWWVTGGWNRLRPDGDQPLAGRYRVEYGVLGLRYALDGFDRVLYVNARGERSRDQDGTPTDNILTAGIRWGF